MQMLKDSDSGDYVKELLDVTTKRRVAVGPRAFEVPMRHLLTW
jgi:hypothetical protein